MSWEQRLREMVLAGGALAATACGGSTSARAGADADAAYADGASDDATAPSGSSAPCCNASPDPCCGCAPNEVQDPAACSDKMACEADGGTWRLEPAGGATVTFGCNFPSDAGRDVVADAAPDASASDAADAAGE